MLFIPDHNSVSKQGLAFRGCYESLSKEQTNHYCQKAWSCRMWGPGNTEELSERCAQALVWLL